MKTQKNTVLITGGGSGIGFETAKLFSQHGNTVILLGRNEEKLKAATAKLNNAHYIVADVTNEGDLTQLLETITAKFPNLNILMNNAGRAFLHNIGDSATASVFAREEMETNYFAAVNLTNKLLPLLKNQHNAAIINVSSIVALAPGLQLPTYSASKAPLHTNTQALRISLSLIQIS
ncbi:SDR family NAD(P)-dependent oxidoreductase [Chryseosolibacter indicus]|uniref:SDR family NAD(P)-dependent oxidoreductase n=1 Tax=Chryseosolibacter indicus TaxID=2782351 RepID=A0ABS5VYC6_9BACT|nr:SDR family NAD(P)-dependent oxidoreductase [Chryseosolibacter indicus]MBT1705754.1 SDR family NAD(P)-dependent oxidoreductase [Chryseosolibacter indicus]